MNPRSRMRGPSRPDPQATTARRHRPDYWLVALAVLLVGIGLVTVFSIGPALAESKGLPTNYYVNRQLIAVALSVVAFFVASRLPLQGWRSLAKPLIIAAVIATFLAYISPASEVYSAHRWVRLGGLSFQSVELVKFALLITLASLLAKRMTDGTITDASKTLKPLLIVVAVIGFVIAGIQSDLGSTGVMLAMMAAMVFVAGMPLRRVMLFGAVVALLGTIAIASTPYRRERLNTFFHPTTSNCSQDADGYQACRAIVAVGSGGIFGLGIGSSVQAHGYTPEAANDSIFAIYAEMTGFLGAIALLAIFGFFFTRIANIAERAPDNFSRLLVVGILTWFGIQALVNIGAMVGLLPLKGITLPFISYGGTSIVFVAAAVGIVFNISQFTKLGTLRVRDDNQGGRHDDRSHGRRIRGAYHPDLSGRSRA